MKGDEVVVSPERKAAIEAGTDSLTLYEMYCSHQNDFTLYTGSIFILFAVFRAFYSKAQRRNMK